MSSSTEVSNDGYARVRVPEEQTGSARKVFFIVAGSLCGLPAFLLSAQVARSLGFRDAILAFLVGTSLAALLGAGSVYAGARTRMGLALLAEHSFGSKGAQVVKLVISISLVGWFGVIVAVLGATASHALADIANLNIPAPAISIPLSALIALVAMRGAEGLEKLGAVIVPLVILIVLYALYATSLDAVAVAPSGLMSFGAAVSAVTGAYIVGIIIQPDYGRFVKKPAAAATATACALGIAFPAILVSTSLPAVATGLPDLIAVTISLGVGIPALVLLLLGAWIDASACLYSGALSLVNQFRPLHFRPVIICVTILGVVLALLHAETFFVKYLSILGIALPPVAIINVLALLNRSIYQSGAKSWSVPGCVGWASGVLAGTLSNFGIVGITGIAAYDSVIVAGIVAFILGIFISPAKLPEATPITD